MGADGITLELEARKRGYDVVAQTEQTSQQAIPAGASTFVYGCQGRQMVGECFHRMAGSVHNSWGWILDWPRP